MNINIHTLHDPEEVDVDFRSVTIIALCVSAKPVCEKPYVSVTNQFMKIAHFLEPFKIA